MSALHESMRRAQLARADRVGALLVAGLGVLLLLIIGRVVQLQVMPSDRLQAHMSDRMSRQRQLAQRGDLRDRRGRLLAATRTGYRIFVDPTAIRPPYGETIQPLASILGMDVDAVAERIISRIEQNRQRAMSGKKPVLYTAIGGILTDEQVAAVREANLSGVHLETRSVRETFTDGLIDSLVGKVGVDHDGLLGAELAFDDALQPEPGSIRYVRDHRGRPMWVEASDLEMPERGSDTLLSFDFELQRIAHEELMRGIEDADAAGGRLLMIDPMTGEILAMVDIVREMQGLAAFDPSQHRKGFVEDGIRYQTIRDDDGREIHPALARNRCVEDLYEPGSTFKPFMWATVTEMKLAGPEEEFQTHNGVWKTAYGRAIRDVVKAEKLTWRDVLVFSSNIGMAQGTERLSARQMHEAVVKFGFGSKTGIRLPGESPGLVTSARDWTKYTHTSVAMGYEVGVTPLQMVRAFSCFARHGEMAGTMPDLRLTVERPDEVDNVLRRRVMSSWIALQTRQIMSEVVKNMAGRVARERPDDPPMTYSAFGKSGTAKIVRPDGRGYFARQYNSSFIVGAPLDQPRIVVLVVIDDPGPSMVRSNRYYGSAVAGPVVLRVVQRSLEYLGVRPDAVDPKDVTASSGPGWDDRG